jgi:hypothetical protein
MLLGAANAAGTSSTRLSANTTNAAFWMTQIGTGSGVRGESTGGHGGLFLSTTKDRFGLLAQNTAASTGAGAALKGEGKQNNGVLGTSAVGTGVLGSSGSGTGVVGTSSTSTGVRGTSNDGIGVRAESQDSDGLYATSLSGRGVYASTASLDAAVYGTSVLGIGLHGTGAEGGVKGESENYGVLGTSVTSIGVRGESTNNTGISGSGAFIGVEGVTTVGRGVSGTATTGIGVYATADAGGTALRAQGAGIAAELAGPVVARSYIEIDAMTAPANPGPDKARLFVRTNGAKDELCVRFNTGDVRVIIAEL